MVKYQGATLDATFAALADPTRRAILIRLAHGESSVTKLAEPFAMSLPAVSKHLKVLERAGLLVREKEGRLHRCCMAAGPMKEVAEWINRYQSFWEQQLDALDRYLNRSTEKEDHAWPAKHQSRSIRSRLRERSRRHAKRSFGRGRARRK